ncbi:hypothetical protein C731_1935 [Mycolicibacterium hassiacum DSM 44199]|uniref:Uncharacterized protein n=1 Tax=Mycolicibacterium hassiacum (strain DSM 44199 / CIP 105218 / JCM 12690 / 3849) TaxID=1122247 RepID=K5BBI5_MYCHD|nr:hypothetical protein [Mycolicibacterium hassiacum]EKF24050.1 hypothetical protein C731_1935 [Mycolicibacterium hassiacum DSM 44199]MDA4088509.1 hypothetical protein [Mycolicibacterium hassiacum DSM 44199]VCT90578.1 hypothetical protein MHAS_02287 [Mycolicibacterium hassiacum DSM 44199]
MRRRREPEQLDPIAEAAATPDEPFDAVELLMFDRVSCGSFEALAAMQEARRRQLNTSPPPSNG